MFARTIGRARPARATPADKRADARAAATRAMTRPVALGDARAVFTTSAFKANAVERARRARARGETVDGDGGQGGGVHQARDRGGEGVAGAADRTGARREGA